MAQGSTLLSLPQMVDLALNCPEVGTVNFNILHALLHVLIQQIEAADVNVEFRGKDSDRLQHLIGAGKPGPTLNLTEYVVTDGGKDRKLKKKGKRKGSQGQKSQEKLPSPAGSTNALQTIVVVEPTAPTTDTPHFTVAIPKSDIHKMENDIEDLRGKIKELTDLPGNIGLIDAIRTDKSSPILDMFQILNLTKRIDGTETAIEKLATMIEDLAKEGVPGAMMPIGDRAEEVRQSVSSGASTGGVLAKVESIEKRVIKLEDVITSGDFGTDDKIPPSEQMDDVTDETDLSKLPPSQAIGIIQKELERLRGLIGSKDGDNANISVDGEGEGEGEGGDNQISDCLHRIMNLDEIYNNQFTILQQRLDDVEKEVTEVLDKINLGMPGGDTAVNEDNFLELCEKFKQMETEMLAFAETTQKLEEEKEERRKAVEALLEQIDLLKIIKANREDLEDALNDKADACAIERKVSQDQFNLVCDDLTKGIDDTLQRLSEQEELWQQALEEIQKEIGSKLDKLELNALRDFVTKKLKFLQDKFKKLSNLREQTEAAGTRSKLLKNVNCISCDKDVVMRTEMDATLKPKPYSMPPPKNIAPYLAYELDQLRKQQKCLPAGRNLNYFEKSLKDHRHCGGSHTITTPQQRVTRMGNFLDQWPGGKGDENLMSIKAAQRKLSAEMSQKLNMTGSITVQGDILADKPEKEEDQKKGSGDKLPGEGEEKKPEAGDGAPRKSTESAQKRLSARGSLPAGAEGAPAETPAPEGEVSSKKGSMAETKRASGGSAGKRPSQQGASASASQLQPKGSGEMERKGSQQAGSKTSVKQGSEQKLAEGEGQPAGSKTEVAQPENAEADVEKKQSGEIQAEPSPAEETA